MQSQRNGISETAEQAASAIADTAQAMRDTAADIGARAGEYAREAGRQTSTAARTAYGAGGDVMGMVESFARGNVWGSLLIAAAVGYGLACVVKTSRTD